MILRFRAAIFGSDRTLPKIKLFFENAAELLRRFHFVKNKNKNKKTNQCILRNRLLFWQLLYIIIYIIVIKGKQYGK